MASSSSMASAPPPSSSSSSSPSPLPLPAVLRGPVGYLLLASAAGGVLLDRVYAGAQPKSVLTESNNDVNGTRTRALWRSSVWASVAPALATAHDEEAVVARVHAPPDGASGETGFDALESTGDVMPLWSVVAMRLDGVALIAAGPEPGTELFLEDALRALGKLLRSFFPKRVTETELAQNYTKLCVVVDEAILEGHVDTTDAERVRRSMKMK
mmetsp:Transcript_1521/g.4125  ORF Transcript_1521/g.4125 Transcript_1521/m.4125 type:complete len:213 (+) Transcript_1521:40-678(+)